MKIFIVIEIVTINKIGYVGTLEECQVFKTEKEAIEFIREQTEDETDKEIEADNRYSVLDYATREDGDEIRWYIKEKEI